MKNVAIVNAYTGGSTGNIAYGLYKALIQSGYNPVYCYGVKVNNYRNPPENSYYIESSIGHKIHRFFAKYTGKQGFYSTHATKKFVSYLLAKQIDTIYVLNIHEYFLNEELFYTSIGRMGIKTICLLTDEYAFLGKCCFSEDCIEYYHGCGNCRNLKTYPPSYFFDRSREIFSMKQRAYSYVKDFTFVGPEYVIEKAKMSPSIQGKKLVVLDEAIDTDVFCPKDNKKIKSGLSIPEDKIIILCVAPGAAERKGCRYFHQVATELQNDERYLFIHIGFSGDASSFAENFMAIPYVSDLNLLSDYMSVADLFLFPSLSDTMPNACLDALACGTPLLCFNISGMPYIGDEEVLTLVPPRDIDALKKVILATRQKNENTIQKCREYALMRYDSKNYNKKLINIAIE